MTEKEVFQEITSKPKWYAGYTTPQNASNMKKRFNDGRLTAKRIRLLFNHFGYQKNESWQKQNNS